MTCWDQVSTRASRWSKLGKFGCNRALQPGILVASTNRGHDFGEPAEEETRAGS